MALHQIVLDERGRGTGLRGEGLEIFRVRAECLCGWEGKWIFADRYRSPDVSVNRNRIRTRVGSLDDSAREEAEHGAVEHLREMGFVTGAVSGMSWGAIRRAIEERERR